MNAPPTLFLALLLASLSAAACAPAAEDGVRGNDELRTDGAAGAGEAGAGEAGADAGADAPSRPDASELVDPRDGQSYPTLTVGSKTWLARNLNFAIAGASFCYGDASSNCDKDGRLYLWSVARSACPVGWHLGSDEDWKSLEAAVGMKSSQLDLEGYETVRGASEGITLKASNGFAAHMAGFRAGTTYEAIGERTYFWTSTTRGAEVWRRRVAAAEPTIFRFTNPPATFAISVRCAKD